MTEHTCDRCGRPAKYAAQDLQAHVTDTGHKSYTRRGRARYGCGHHQPAPPKIYNEPRVVEFLKMLVSRHNRHIEMMITHNANADLSESFNAASTAAHYVYMAYAEECFNILRLAVAYQASEYALIKHTDGRLELMHAETVESRPENHTVDNAD